MEAPTNLHDLVAQWRAVHEERVELERLAAAIEKGPEAQAKDALLTHLKLTGQDSVRLADGGGTVSRKVTTSVWMADAEIASQYLLGRLKSAEAEGRPLTDELLFQQRPAQNAALALAKEILEADGRPSDFDNLNQVLAGMGFKAVQTEHLSYRQGSK